MSREADLDSALELVGTAVQATYPWTLSGWFNADTNFCRFFAITDVSTNDNFWIAFLLSGNTVFSAGDSVDSGTSTSTTTYSANTWNAYAAVLESSTDRRVYLNAGGVGSESTDITPTGLDTSTAGKLSRLVGDDYQNAVQLAQLAIWDVGLTTTELASLAVGFAPEDIRPGSLVMILRLFRDSLLDEIGGTVWALDNAPAITDNPPNLIPTYEGTCAA